MEKNKNIKNKNLKLSNFVMKLGMVSTVAGTVAAGASISEYNIEKQTVSFHSDNISQESVETSIDNKKISKGKEQHFSVNNIDSEKIWDTRIESGVVSNSKINSVNPKANTQSYSTVSQKSIAQNDGRQLLNNVKYDFETTSKEKPYSIDTKTYNSNIKGRLTMFEDKYHNLWSMGSKSSIQTFDYGTHTWTEQSINGAANSNVDNGDWGTFFQDSEGTLWSMGHSTNLQKFTYGANHSVLGGTWEEENVSNSGSKIISGFAGTIFEDSHKFLWALGEKTPLQKLDLNDHSANRKWIDANLLEKSNITNGFSGFMYQDSHGTLWAGGQGPLQKYDYSTNSWSDAGENSNIKNSVSGTIFEDSKGNLWSIGDDVLQKYDYSNPGWVEQSSHGSKFTNSRYAKIFEDSIGNLWMLARGSGLEKYDYASENWEEQTKINSGSNIIDGCWGNIFEDSEGTIYTEGWSGKGQFLQESRDGGVSWVQSPGVITHPMLETQTSYKYGCRNSMFEDSHGIIWHASTNTPLQFKLPGSKYWTHSSNITINHAGATNIIPWLFEDSYGTLWSAGPSKLSYSYDNGETWIDVTDPKVNFIPTDHSMFLEDIEHNFLWILSDGAITQYDYSTKTWVDQTNSKSSLVNGNWGQIYKDSKGNLWSMGLGTALQKYDYVTKTWIQQTVQNSGSVIANGFASSMFEINGVLWAGSSYKGFQRYIGNKWVQTSPPPINDGYTADFCLDAKHKRTWVITRAGAQWCAFGSDVWVKAVKYDTSIDTTILANGKLFIDSYGTLWLISNGIPLQKFDYNTETWINQDATNSGSNILNGRGGSIFQDSHGTLWSYGPGTQIQRSDDGVKWYDSSIKIPQMTSSMNASQIFEDSSGTIWFSISGFPIVSYRYDDPVSMSVSSHKGSISLSSYCSLGKMYLRSSGVSKFSNIPGLKMKYAIKNGNAPIDWNSQEEWNGSTLKIDKPGVYVFHFDVDNSLTSITKNSLPKDFSIEFNEEVLNPKIVPLIIQHSAHNGEDGIIGYGKFTNPDGAKLEVSENGGPFNEANENGYSLKTKLGNLRFKWQLDDFYYWKNKKEPKIRDISIGQKRPQSDDLDKNYEDIVESKVQHISKDVNFDFEDWTADSFNALKSNTIKHIKLSNSANDLTADLEVQIHADSEHKLSYKILKIQYDTKGTKVSSDFYPVITKELMSAKGYITPSDDLNTQQEAQDKVLAKAKKEITDALGKITFDKIHDTAYEALVKNLPATWNPVSEKVSLSHQDYKVEVKKTIDSKNGKIVLKLNVFQPPISRAVASDKIEIQGFLGLDSLLTKQTELEDRIKEIFGKTSGIDKLTIGVFNADLNNVTKKISIKGYAKTHLDLTVHIKATADDKLSYTIDPKVIIKDDNVDVKETLAPTIFSTISNWHNDITVAPKFLSYADIKAKASKQTIEAELTKGLTKFEPSTKISIKINDDYYLDLVLDLSEASSTELRYEVDSFALKYKGNDLPDAQSSPELKSLIGLSEKMNASSTVQGTFPTLVALKDLASKSIDSYVLEKFKYFDFQDWTVDSFNSQPANRTAKIRIYGENDTSAELEISVTADSEKIISYKVTNVVVKEKGVQKIGGPFQSISDDFAAKSGQTQTHDDFRTEKEAQLKAADKAKDDMRIAIDKMTFDKAELPFESESKVFAGWKGQDKYEAYHQEFDVTYNQVAKDSTGEIIVTSTVAPFTKTGPKKCTPESVTNTVSGFMGITQLTNMQSKVKQAILDEFAKQHLNELTSYFFNKDTKNNVMEVVIDGFGDTTAELTLKLDATADDKLSYTVTDVVVKNGIKVVPDSIAGNAISELKKWTGDVDLNPGFLTEEEYEKNLVTKNFKANPNELASEVINAKNTGVSKAVKGEYEFENADFRIDYTPDDESGEVLGKVTRKGSSSNVQETISGFLKFKTFADAVKTKDLESKLLSVLDKYEDSKTFNFKINDDYALELTVAVLPKDDNTISYSVSGFDVKHNGKSLSDAQNSATLKALLKMKGDIKVPKTNTKLLDVIYEKLHGKSRRLDMSQLTKAASIPKPKPTIDLNEVTKELGEFYVSGEQSGSAKLLEENNAPDAAGFEFEFQVINDKKPLSEPTKTLPVNLKNGEHVKITSVLKDGYQVKGKMPEKDIPVVNLKEDKSIDAAKLTKATEIKEIPEIKEVPKIAKPASKSNGLMIGLVVAGSVTGLILIGLLALMVVKKRKKRS